MNNEKSSLFAENAAVGIISGCALCREAKLGIGQSAGYGLVIFRVGNKKNGWFAALSPKTGGNVKSDFTIQLMPMQHLTHFSQMESYPKLAENFGVAFSRLCKAMVAIMIDNEKLLANAGEKNKSVPVATYGKCTTWKEKKEHLHIKIFPFRGSIGQPYTVDSSFGKKEIFSQNGDKFVKMDPIKKKMISPAVFNNLAKMLIKLLK